MTRARTLADLGSQSLATDAEVSAAIAASGKYGSGYTDAYSVGGSTAIINRAVRVVDNTEHEFTNLTFNMPSHANTDTSDWTDPGDGSYKWSYVYIRPSDDKFFISDTEPSVGENSRNIGGSELPYLFCIYSDNDNIRAFTISGNHYVITNQGASISHYNVCAGLLLYSTSFGSPNSTTDANFNAASKMPNTASIWSGTFAHSAFLRRDAGGSGTTTCFLYIADSGGSLAKIAGSSRQHHVDTPTASGGYYLTDNAAQTYFMVSNDEYDISNGRITWSASSGSILAGGDARNSARVNLHSFTDRNIF